MALRGIVHHWIETQWQRSLGAWQYAQQRGYIGLVPYGIDGREVRSRGRIYLGEWYITRHGIYHGAELGDYEDNCREKNRLLAVDRREYAAYGI